MCMALAVKMPNADLHIEMPQQLLSTASNGRLPPVRKTSQTSVERIMRRSERKLSVSLFFYSCDTVL